MQTFIPQAAKSRHASKKIHSAKPFQTQLDMAVPEGGALGRDVEGSDREEFRRR